MRHRKKGRKLGRNSSHRKALFSNLATALFRHERIKTTQAKAKELRGIAERIITSAKKDDLASRRNAAKTIHDHEILRKLFDDIAKRYAERNGGYTRIIKIGPRLKDGAFMVFIELV